MTDNKIDFITRELQTKHACHTIILYGSWARGDATEASDYDLLGIRETGEIFRDARLRNGVYLDIFIYPEAKLAEPDDQMLYLRRGKILCQKANVASLFLSRLEEIYRAGPKKLRTDEIQALCTWHQKALARIKRGGIQGNLRRAELFPAILEHFFTTRAEWYEGPKAGFQWLKENCPDIYSAFEMALEPTSPFSAIEQLVNLVNDTIAKNAKPADVV